MEALSVGFLDSLVSNRARESKTREFKRDLPDESDRGKHRYLATLASLANSEGGSVYFGIEAADGIATGVVGVGTEDLDATILHLEHLAQDGVAPRIPALSFHHVWLDDERGHALEIRVPASWRAPHMVTQGGGGSRFYGRNAAGRFQMDVGQIRDAFLAAEGLANRIREFRSKRVKAIQRRHTPVVLDAGACLVLHLIPFSGFSAAPRVDLGPLAKNPESLTQLHDTRLRGLRWNLDGLVGSVNPDGGARPGGYAQVFHTGAIEYVNTWLLRNDGLLPSQSIEESLYRAADAGFGLLAQLQVPLPVSIGISLLSVSGRRFAVHGYDHHEHLRGFDRDFVLIPDLLRETEGVLTVRDIMSVGVEMLWQAAGWPGSPFTPRDEGTAG